MFHKEITIPIFGPSLNLLIVENELEFKYIYAAERHFAHNVPDGQGSNSVGFFHSIDINGFELNTICLNKRLIDRDGININNTIAHEVFHYVHHLTQNLRMNLTDDSEEVYAYLIGYLVEVFDTFLEEYETYKEEYITNDLEYIIENVNELSVYDLLQKLIFWALDGPLLSSKMLQKLSKGEDELSVKKEIIELMKNVS